MPGRFWKTYQQPVHPAAICICCICCGAAGIQSSFVQRAERLYQWSSLKPSRLVRSQAVPLGVPLGVHSKKFSNLNAGLEVELVGRAIIIVFQNKSTEFLRKRQVMYCLGSKANREKKKEMQMLFVGLPVRWPLTYMHRFRQRWFQFCGPINCWIISTVTYRKSNKTIISHSFFLFFTFIFNRTIRDIVFITQSSLSVSTCEQSRPCGSPRVLTHNPPPCRGFIEVAAMAQGLPVYTGA